MKRVLAIAAVLVFLVSSSHLYAAEKQYADGQIITVEKKFHDRVLYYQVKYSDHPGRSVLRDYIAIGRSDAVDGVHASAR